MPGSSHESSRTLGIGALRRCLPHRPGPNRPCHLREISEGPPDHPSRTCIGVRLVSVDRQTVSRELYALAPSEFTAARDAKAAEARKTGDRQLAAAIKQLKRPSAAAWLANSLARHRSHRIDELLLLGERLRDAQRQFAGDELRDLSRQGRRLVGELVDEGERLALSAGSRPNASALRQLQETLEAALADLGSARALRSGHLAAPLSYAGLGPDGFDATSVEADAHRRTNPADEVSAELHAAERRIAESSAELQSAQRRRDRVQEQVDELERQLKQVRAEQSEIDRRISELDAAITEATTEATRARERLRR